MSETIDQPCDECGVDTVKLLSERDQLRAELADCNRMLDETRAKLPTMAQVMVYGSLLRKFKASQAQLADCQKRLEEARWLLVNSGDASMALGYGDSKLWLTRRDAFLATFKDKT